MPTTVAEIMGDVPSLSPEDDARRAIEVLAELDISAVPVVDGEDHVIGIVSESDLVLSGEEADLHLPHFLNLLGGVVFVGSLKGFEERLQKAFATQVSDLMTRDPICVRTATAIDRAARLIAQKHHNHLPVIDEDGRLVGLVTRADVLAALVGDSDE